MKLDGIRRTSSQSPGAAKQENQPSIIQKTEEASVTPTTGQQSKLITYEALGWSAPESGQAIKEKLDAIEKRMRSMISFYGRSKGGLFQMRNDIYVLKEGEKVPGFDDDCISRLSVAPLDPDGQMLQLKSISDNGLCLLNSSVVLAVGSVLEVEDVSWKGVKIQRGSHTLSAHEILGQAAPIKRQKISN